MAKQDTELNLDIDTPKAGKGKLILVIVLGIVLLGVIAGVVAFFLMGGEDKPAEDAKVEEVVDPTKSQAFYIGLENPITVNILGDKRERMLQVDIQMVVRGTAAEERVKRHLPLLTNGLLQVFSGANPDTLRRPDGRDELRQLALTKVQELMVEQEGSDTIEAILFTGFVMQ